LCGLEESCSNSNFESANVNEETASTKVSDEKLVFSFGLNREDTTPKEQKCKDSSKNSKTQKEEIRSSSTSKEEGYKRTLTFSPEFHPGILEKNTSRQTIATKTSPEGTFKGRDWVKDSKNKSTGLSLSNQILASYGLDESHSLEPVQSSSPKNIPKFSTSKMKDDESKTSAVVPNSKKLAAGVKKSSPSSRLLASCGLDDSPIKASSEKTSETKFFTKSRKNSPSRKLLASCGLEDSPVKSAELSHNKSKQPKTEGPTITKKETVNKILNSSQITTRPQSFDKTQVKKVFFD